MTNSDPIHPGEHLAESSRRTPNQPIPLGESDLPSLRRINEIVHGRTFHHGGSSAAFRAGSRNDTGVASG